MNKQTLREFRKMAIEMDQMKSTLDNLRGLIGPGIANYSGMTVSGSSDASKVERAAESIMEVEGRYVDALASYARMRTKIEESITILKTEERAVLRSYYLDHLTWERTAYRLGCSYQHVHRLHASALVKLQDAEKTEIQAIMERITDKPASGLLTED